MSDFLLAISSHLDREPDPADACWEPEGLRFELGDRVRVHLSAECRMTSAAPASIGAITGAPAHAEVEDGLIGTIEDCADPYVPGHPYLVRFDRVIRIGQFLSWGSAFAAAELIPLDHAEGED